MTDFAYKVQAICQKIGKSPNMIDDVIVQDDGEGPYLKKWPYAEPKPSNEAIEAENAFQFMNKKRLAELDVMLPRHIEDIAKAANVNFHPNSVAYKILTEKLSLRAELA